MKTLKTIVAAALLPVAGVAFAQAPANPGAAEAAAEPTSVRRINLDVAEAKAPVDRFFNEFVPTATQVSDFFTVIQQFRGPLGY